MPHLYIPRLNLELDGVDPALARQVAALLPGALERALNPGRGGQRVPPAPGSAQALADQAAGRVASRLLGHLPLRAASLSTSPSPASGGGVRGSAGEGRPGVIRVPTQGVQS